MQTITSLLWSGLLPVLLIAAAILCAIRLRGRPVRGLHHVLRDTYGSLLHPHNANQRKIFAGALAATMGTGNLAGTALALLTGGPGAIFWMWVSALLGMILVCAENLLSARYRSIRSDGTMLGGALGYLSSGLKSRIPVRFFAVCCVCAALGMGNMVQSSTIAQSAAFFDIPAPVAGTVTVILLAILLLGGTARIRGCAVWLMPMLCGLYLLGCMILLCRHAAALPSAFRMIFRNAFGFRAAGGGFAASVLLRSLHEGLKRGIFSNEAGLGSSGLLHMDSADERQQWKWAAAEVFADTVICCTATALVILTAPNLRLSGNDPSALLLEAFSAGLGSTAGVFLAVNMILLAFATIIGWYPCGLAAFRFLFGHKASGIFTAGCLLAAFAGALGSPAWLWCFCDLCNGCMALPNLYGMFRLNRELNPNAL